MIQPANQLFGDKPENQADGHHCHDTQLVAAYVQSQSQASSLGQRGDKRQ